MGKTREELAADIEKYRAQMELFQGKASLTLQEAFDYQAVKNNFMITSVAWLQVRVDDLEEKMTKLLEKPWATGRASGARETPGSGSAT